MPPSRFVMLERIVLTFWLVALPAVALAADVRVDFERHRDFDKYRTFQVEVGSLVRPDGSIDEQNTLAQNRIRNAVTSELLARGLEPTDSGASLVVRISGRDTERVSVVGSGWPVYPGYWHRRWGYWARPYRFGYWGAPFYGDVWTRRYVEGALTVDVFDRQTNALVYRAHVTDEIGKDLDKQVTRSIDKAFKKFPVKEIQR
jgi:Domain of unknown function (DUF4136)